MASAFQAGAFQTGAFQIDAAVIRRGGDDAFRRVPFVFQEHREEEQPKPRKAKRRPKQAIVPATGWPFEFDPIEAQPQFIPDIPRVAMADDVALQAAIQRHLLQKTEQYLADEDDEEVALLLALA